MLARGFHDWPSRHLFKRLSFHPDVVCVGHQERGAAIILRELHRLHSPTRRIVDRWRLETSAFLAVLNRDDRFHELADASWRALVAGDSGLVTTNYVVVEAFAVAQHRQGIDAIRVLQHDILPVVGVEWTTPEDHGGGVQAVFAARRRDLSLVDAVSFAVMRRLGVTTHFGFDPHFGEQGFTPWQPPP